MKNFLIGLVVGIVLSGLTALILIFAVVRIASSFGEKPVAVADGSTVIFKLEGALPERTPPEIPLPMFEAQTPMAVHEVWETFRRAANDSRVKAIIFEPRDLGIGWAKMEEIHDEILQFRKSGKPIVSYLGVKADVVHAGKYKDAGDILTQTAMSPETREVLNDILDQYYGDLVDTIAKGRTKPADDVRQIIDRGPFMAKEALSNGLVDVLGYEEQASEELRNRLKQTELKKVSAKSYLKANPQPGGVVRRIALVVGEGEITRGSGNSSSDDENFTSAAFVKLLKQVEDDSTIKGVIMRVDSPGGDGTASDDILHEAKNLSKKKPLVISMSDLAASGGYFVSVTGDPIVAYPNTLTGSIGVVFARMSLHGLYDKIGVTKQGLTRGHFADLDSDYAPLNDEQRQKISSQIDSFYTMFISRVADGRKKSFDQIAPLAQGRVWLGAEAKTNGLVDELGGLDRAVELIRQKAHFASSDKIVLVPYPGKRSVFDMLFNRTDESAAMETKLGKMLGNIPVRAMTQGGFLKMMPYSISVK